MPMSKSAYEQVLGRKLTDEEYANLSAPSLAMTATGPKLSMPSLGSAYSFGGSANPQTSRPADAYSGSALGAGDKRGSDRGIYAKGADGKMYHFQSSDEFFAAHKNNPSLFGSKTDTKYSGKPMMPNGGTAADRITAETGGAGTIAAKSKADPAPKPVEEKRTAPTAPASYAGMERPPAEPTPNAPIVTSAPAAKIAPPAPKFGVGMTNAPAGSLGIAPKIGQAVTNAPEATENTVIDLWNALNGDDDPYDHIIGEERKKHGL
jgi:hypothetical protein